MSTFNNKTILITGGSSGIGLALARKFTCLGANVLILARRKDPLKHALDIIEADRLNEQQILEMISADVSDFNQINTEITNLAGQGIVPDILINSAGVVHPGEIENLDIEKFQWMMDINYFGTVNTVKSILPFMIERSAGKIVNICSMAGFLGIYGYTAYCGSKFAVRGFSDALRSELKRYHIQVSLVFPPDTNTPQLEYDNKFKPQITKELTSSAGLIEPQIVADAIIKGIEHNKYIITPGFESTLFYTLQSVTGGLVYKIMDYLVKKAQNNIQTNTRA